VAGRINLTMPLATWLGLSGAPGEVPGFGPLGADDARGLAGAMAAHPHTRWCLTLTGSDGRPAGHGCARPGPARGGAARDGQPGGPGPPSAAHPCLRQAIQWLAGIDVQWFESGECAHRRESPGYRPPPALEHLIKVRQLTCAFPGCRRPATRADLDHTLAYHRGGRTCECNLAPLCRQHHRCKQAEGWQLEQLQPGILVWTTPTGGTYTTRPASYPE
jgi:hypothetical protein